MRCSSICRLDEYWIKSSFTLFMSWDILDCTEASRNPHAVHNNNKKTLLSVLVYQSSSAQWMLTLCVCVCVPQAVHCPAMEKMKRIKKRLSLTLRSSQTIDESLSELAEQMTIEESGTKDNGTNVIYCFFPFLFFFSNQTWQLKEKYGHILMKNVTIINKMWRNDNVLCAVLKSAC